MFEIEKSNALEWFQKHIQSVSDKSQAESVRVFECEAREFKSYPSNTTVSLYHSLVSTHQHYEYRLITHLYRRTQVLNAMVDSGMLIPILADDDSQKYVTLGSSLCYRGEDERKKETTTLEIESDSVFRFCADSDASIDRSGTVLFEIRRMVNAALRHTRRLLRKAESTSKLDSNFVKRVSSETDTIETSMNTITSQDIVKISSRIDDANRKKEIETALIAKQNGNDSSVARCTIDSIRVSTDFETKHERLKITEHADSLVVSSMSGYRCNGTGSGSLKYARSALLILERKLIQLSEIQDKIDRGNAVELPEVYWNIKMHDAHGKVVAHDSITSK